MTSKAFGSIAPKRLCGAPSVLSSLYRVTLPLLSNVCGVRRAVQAWTPGATGLRGRQSHTEMPRGSPRSRKTKSGPAMLQQLGDRISACLERAEQCREAAASEIDERVHRQLLDLEQQWQHVAESYQFIESLERFLLDQHHHSLPPEVEMLPKDYPPE